jgi:DNA-binding transcriptional regulator WhiA
MTFMNLKKPEYSYMIAFIQCDGSLSDNTRNRGKLQIELGEKDVELLKQFVKIIPYNTTISYRTRDTNFKKNATFVSLTLYDLNARNKLKQIGMMAGKKDMLIAPPKQPFIMVDYIRGLIDADGSVGITKTELPFISFATKSEHLKKIFCHFIKQHTGQIKNVNRNKRDNIYNIILTKEDAQKIISILYYDGCLALKRKKKLATKALKWKRPSDMKKRDFERKRWDDKQDAVVLKYNDNEKVAKILDRTTRSIEIRRWRLNQQS